MLASAEVTTWWSGYEHAVRQMKRSKLIDCGAWLHRYDLLGGLGSVDLLVRLANLCCVTGYERVNTNM